MSYKSFALLFVYYVLYTEDQRESWQKEPLSSTSVVVHYSIPRIGLFPPSQLRLDSHTNDWSFVHFPKLVERAFFRKRGNSIEVDTQAPVILWLLITALRGQCADLS